MKAIQQRISFKKVLLLTIPSLFFVYIFYKFFFTYNPRILWFHWTSPPAGTTIYWSQQKCDSSLINDITFLILTSSASTTRHQVQRNTWLSKIPSNHVWAFSDEASEYTITLPELKGRPTYADAQHRLLKGMKWLVDQNIPKTKWYIVLDDDTFVNIPLLLRFLTSINLEKSNGKLLAGTRYPYNGVINGGSGMVMSKDTFTSIASNLYAKCQFSDTTDNTISYCADKLGDITVMHSDLFLFYPHLIFWYWDFLEKATVHPVKDVKLMYAMQEEIQKWYPEC